MKIAAALFFAAMAFAMLSLLIVFAHALAGGLPFVPWGVICFGAAGAAAACGFCFCIAVAIEAMKS